MTFVGKLLVVIQVVLSVCFMAFAATVFTVQQNWKVHSEDLAQQIEDLKKAMDEADEAHRQEKDKLQMEIKAATERALAAEKERNNFQDLFNQTKAELDSLRTAQDTSKALVDISGDEANNRRAEALRQRAANEKLHKTLNDLAAKNRALEDQLRALQTEREALLTKHEQTLQELAVLKRYLAELGYDPDPKKIIRRQAPPPLVFGKVIMAKHAKRSGQPDLVEISLGSDDGLIEGHQLLVYRRGTAQTDRAKYLGEIRLVLVTPDRSVGVVVQKAKNGVIQEGDDVTSRL
ncbi:MAG: hypothetical protein D6725_02980 [Planctomycetota bacterium]|nr:MAG: hypothetical protein D6725_02980 [Planctomycetota bacterium]